MKRHIEFVLWVVLFFFIFSYFSNKESIPETAENTVNFTVVDNKVILPEVPEFSVSHSYTDDITLNPCTNLSIRKEGKLVSLPEEQCIDTAVISGEAYILYGDKIDHIETLQKADESEYDVTFTYVPEGVVEEDIESQSIVLQESVTVVQAGGFRQLFRTVFYRPVYNLFAIVIETLPGKEFGWAIVIITVLVRLILLIPQHKMMLSQQKMQTIQPKIKELQAKHKGDQAAIGMKLMELYKKEGVNPMGSCLPLLIQIPLMIVLYWVVQGIPDTHNVYHLYDGVKFAVVDIQNYFFGLDLAQSKGAQGIILALVVGGVQLIQVLLSQLRNKKNPKPVAKKTPKNPDQPQMPDMAEMMKIMMWIIPVMVAIFTYQFPAGVGIYWLVGTIFMIGQQIVVNKVLKKEKKPAHEVIVEVEEKK